ncbi:MAPEG family protein [Mangrovimicrobium sediminis]|uniref:MAPEG family protein n=1 Tax=Mangrovimicrobium sediminis TaxID=2562682 RepID=A0A4Z0LY52_9GAMM|nr:MAPEG family protein [Haliea sp. SAOS-164]TGD72293.1 MAPEG family protein [Haliea sp. SAOS-164]
MTVIVACLIIGAILPLLAKAPLGYVQARQPGGYDNRYPRQQQAALDGLGQRALGAHENAFEAFPAFAAGVLLALSSNGPAAMVQTLCLVWVAARVGHLAFYLADIDKLRSLCWLVGMVCAIWLMCLALP